MIIVTYESLRHSALDKLAYLVLQSMQHTQHRGPKVSKIKILLPNAAKKGPNKIQRSHHQTGPKGPFKNKDRTTKRVQKDQSKIKDRTTKQVQKDQTKIKIAPPKRDKKTK